MRSFMSTREKALVQKAWVRFLKNGQREKDFSDRLYQHLISNFLYHRYYARSGLYATHFENRDDTVRFLFDKLAANRSVENGRYWWLNGYEDLNEAMIEEAAR